MTDSIKNNNQRSALILGGGGARAAYQVGVLKAIAELNEDKSRNPFPIICGTSAGSINAVALASNAADFQTGVDSINDVWANFELHHVFYADAKSLTKRILLWIWSNIGPGDWQKGPSSMLDNRPLRQLLTKYINFESIDKAIASGDLHAYCLTACSYTSAESTTFYDGADEITDWSRTLRDGQRRKLTIDHLMASSAIPVVFSSVEIEGEHYGDGSMRQMSPISPALHLGAEKILIIGLRRESKLRHKKPPKHRPSLGQITGYVLDTLFLNSLNSDIERMERVNRILRTEKKERHTGTGDPLKVVEHMVISPSQDIADIAKRHYSDLPKSFRIALKFLGMDKGNSRRFISYLMFTSSFCRELIELGYNDAMNDKDTLIEFLKK